MFEIKHNDQRLITDQISYLRNVRVSFIPLSSGKVSSSTEAIPRLKPGSIPRVDPIISPCFWKLMMMMFYSPMFDLYQMVVGSTVWLFGNDHDDNENDDDDGDDKHYHLPSLTLAGSTVWLLVTDTAALLLCFEICNICVWII